MRRRGCGRTSSKRWLGWAKCPLEEYYSLCNRLDTLEHVHEVLVAVAAQMMGDTVDPDPEAGDAPDDVPVPVADEPSGRVN